MKFINRRLRNVPSRLLLMTLAVALSLVGATSLAPVTTHADSTHEALYRLYNPYNGDHFYTVSWPEVGSATNSGYQYEGIAGYTSTVADPSNNYVALYRMYNPYTGDHFYTTSPTEQNAATSIGYSSEGNVGYIPAISKSSSALYRFSNKTNGHHFYTASVSEATAVANSGGWNSEGITGYLWQN